jgi:hypothetical protein
MREVFPTFLAPANITLNLIIVFTPSFFDYNLIIVNINIKVLIFNHKNFITNFNCLFFQFLKIFSYYYEILLQHF